MTTEIVDEEEEIIEMEDELDQRRKRLDGDADLDKATRGLKTEEYRAEEFDADQLHGMVILYALSDGEPVSFPLFMKPRMLRKRDRDGKRMFTTRRSAVPEYVRGTVKCFKNPEAAEAPEVRGLGIALNCKAAHLANPWAKEEHEYKKHRRERQSYQRILDTRLQDTYRQEQRDRDDLQRQLNEALVALAGRNSAPVAVAPKRRASAEMPCPDCTFTARNAFGLAAHRRGKHKET